MKDAFFSFVVGTFAFVMWPLLLPFLIFAMGPWGSLERRRVARMAAGLMLVTALWCACALAVVWYARGWW